MRYTAFQDNYSDNKMKTIYNYIFIEGSKENACKIFEKEFGFSPKRRTKTEITDVEGYNARDYHIEEVDDIIKYTMCMRRCKFNHDKMEFEEAPGCENYKTFYEYVKNDGNSFERAKFIRFTVKENP